MIIEIEKKYDQHGDQYYLEFKIEYEDEDDDEVMTIIDNRRFHDLQWQFRDHYRTHRALYELINEEKFLNDRYYPDSNDFNNGSNGWLRFVNDLTDRELRTMTNLYTDIIIDKVEYIQRRQRQTYKSRVKTTLKTGQIPVELEKLDFSNNDYMVTNNKVYKVELLETDGLTSINDLEENLYNTILDDLKQQLETERRNYKVKIERLRRKQREDKNNLFVETVNHVANLDRWDIVKINNETWLKYKDRIKTDKVSFNGQIFPYDDENYKSMFVTGLKVKVGNIVTENDVRITRGYNLHFRGTTGCIGDLNGAKLFDVLEKLPETLRIANMDSPLNSDIQLELSNGFLEDLKNENGDIIGGSRIWTTNLEDE